MRNFTIYLSLILCLYLSKMSAQESFEDKAKAIATKIDAITKEEKAALKTEVEAVNVELDNKTITSAQADEKKQLLAATRAKNIETRIAAVDEELSQLVKDRVEGRIKDNDSTRTYKFVFNTKRPKKTDNSEARTTSQLVFAMGVNNVVTDGAVAHSDFRYFGSHFYELGIGFSSRLAKNNNLLHARYGLSLQYNNLRPTDDRYFAEAGDQTGLASSPIDLKDSRFHNVNLVVPVGLEFDFTKPEVKDGKTIFRTHQTFRFGLGGYGGFNIKSKQILKFDDADGNDVTQKTKGNFNVNDLVYGVSAYIGYKDVSLYSKYDLSPLFTDNAVQQRNVSVGIRWDWN